MSWTTMRSLPRPRRSRASWHRALPKPMAGSSACSCRRPIIPSKVSWKTRRKCWRRSRERRMPRRACGRSRRSANRNLRESSRRSALLIRVGRVPPFPKRRDSFLVVAGFKQHHLLTVLDHQRGIDAGGVDQRVQGLLGQAQTHRRGAGHFGGEGKASLEQLVVGNDVTDQSYGLGPVRIEKPPGQQQFRRHGETDQPGQQIAGSHVTAADADTYVGGVHPRSRRGKANIGGEQQRKSSTTCGTVQQRNNRLRAASHQADNPRVALLHDELPLRPSLSWRDECVRTQFGPGAKLLSIAPEYDNPRTRAVMKSRKIADQFVGHHRVYRIAGVRSIKGDDFNRIALLDSNCRESFHLVRSPYAIIRRRNGRMSRCGADCDRIGLSFQLVCLSPFKGSLAMRMAGLTEPLRKVLAK